MTCNDCEKKMHKSLLSEGKDRLLCNQDNKLSMPSNSTNDWDKVNCKKCLKLREKTE